MNPWLGKSCKPGFARAKIEKDEGLREFGNNRKRGVIPMQERKWDRFTAIAVALIVAALVAASVSIHFLWGVH